jgi:RHS repeat-associated protein
LTDSSGSVVKTYTYEAFGSLVAQSGSVVNPYQFQTKQFSSAIGLVHFGFRSYNPAIGRFITADPLGFVNGPNVYVYVGNDPTNWIDPWGLCGEKPWWGKGIDWWLWETSLPGPYGQPMSEWGPQGPTDWGDPMKYPEEAGGWWKWGEKIAVGTAAVTSVTALGLGVAEMAGLINTAPQGNNILRIISKVWRWGWRLDKAEPGKWIHQHFWRW